MPGALVALPLGGQVARTAGVSLLRATLLRGSLLAVGLTGVGTVLIIYSVGSLILTLWANRPLPIIDLITRGHRDVGARTLPMLSTFLYYAQLKGAAGAERLHSEVRKALATLTAERSTSRDINLALRDLIPLLLMMASGSDAALEAALKKLAEQNAEIVRRLSRMEQYGRGPKGPWWYRALKALAKLLLSVTVSTTAMIGATLFLALKWIREVIGIPKWVYSLLGLLFNTMSSIEKATSAETETLNKVNAAIDRVQKAIETGKNDPELQKEYERLLQMREGVTDRLENYAAQAERLKEYARTAIPEAIGNPDVRSEMEQLLDPERLRAVAGDYVPSNEEFQEMHAHFEEFLKLPEVQDVIGSMVDTRTGKRIRSALVEQDALRALEAGWLLASKEMAEEINRTAEAVQQEVDGVSDLERDFMSDERVRALLTEYNEVTGSTGTSQRALAVLEALQVEPTGMDTREIEVMRKALGYTESNSSEGSR